MDVAASKPAGTIALVGAKLLTMTGDGAGVVDDGVVVMNLWTPETGYLIEIQHSNNLISIYKNLSKSLVAKGQRIKRGGVIGSNTEVLADGGDAKIFEFELWSNGKPVDPESYIVF